MIEMSESRMIDLCNLWAFFAVADWGVIVAGKGEYEKKRKKALARINKENARMKDEERALLAEMVGCSRTLPLITLLDALTKKLLEEDKGDYDPCLSISLSVARCHISRVEAYRKRREG